MASAAGAGPGSSAAATTAKEGETSKTDQDETMKRVAEDTAAIGSADAVEVSLNAHVSAQMELTSVVYCSQSLLP